jgi:hypothetical protein
MGNIISNTSDHTLLNSNSVLKTIIENWALNDYDAGLNYNRAPTDGKVKELLKKRACCTQRKEMIIALPEIDTNHLKTPLSAASKSLIKEGYYPVQIRVFDENETISSSLCKFNDTKNEEKDYFQQKVSKTTGVSANLSCAALYASGATDLKLCKKIKNENNLIYHNASQGAYGYYAKENSYDTLVTNNNYLDCTCKNSTLQDVNIASDNILLDTHINNNEILVQTNDSYCTNCSATGKCYIPSDQKVDSLCINIQNARNLVAEYNSNIMNTQSCGGSLVGAGSGTGTGTGDDTDDSGDTTAASIDAIIEKYKMHIIIGFIVLIASIVGTIIILK